MIEQPVMADEESVIRAYGMVGTLVTRQKLPNTCRLSHLTRPEYGLDKGRPPIDPVLQVLDERAFHIFSARR
jgi:hypothetical protein